MILFLKRWRNTTLCRREIRYLLSLKVKLAVIAGISRYPSHNSHNFIICQNFRSSLYYWAHYDFFNNTKLGEAVPGKKCDEVFASWKQTKGWLRSPLNTLIYKQQHTNEDVTCLYRFVTDKRLFARVILTITCVNFKVGHSTS